MPTPYYTLSDDTLNLLAERGDDQALMELAHRAERLGILAEAQELANRLREAKKTMDGQACETPLVELLERVPEDARAWYEHGPMNHSHIPYGLLCRRAATEIRRLTELANRLREEKTNCGRCPLDARNPDHDCAAPDCLEDA